MARRILEIGEIFVDLTIVEKLGVIKGNNYFLCNCSCGKQRKVMFSHLVSGLFSHCGCKKFISKQHANQKFEPTEASFRAKATNYKSLAKTRKLEFTLTIQETVELLKGNCHYCNAIPSNYYNVRKFNRINRKNNIQYVFHDNENHAILYNGIDRIDNSKGYILNNVVSCCTHCNTAKLNYNISDFKKWIINLYNKTIKNEDTTH